MNALSVMLEVSFYMAKPKRFLSRRWADPSTDGQNDFCEGRTIFSSTYHERFLNVIANHASDVAIFYVIASHPTGVRNDVHIGVTLKIAQFRF